MWRESKVVERRQCLEAVDRAGGDACAKEDQGGIVKRQGYGLAGGAGGAGSGEKGLLTS